MKTYKWTEEVKKYDKLVSVACDICKRKKPRAWGDDWTDNNFDENSVVVKHRHGTSYPEGGSGTELDLDICPSCFIDKLLPFLRSLGVETEYKEWDW